MKRVFIGIGSNLNHPTNQVKQAAHRLAQMLESQWVRMSSLYRSRPLGPQDQPDFINAVSEMMTSLPPEVLLKELQTIELSQGRTRTMRWGPRTIDLDILLYGNEIIQTETLTIPHVGLKERRFVVDPLYEIAPDLILPTGEPLVEFVESRKF